MYLPILTIYDYYVFYLPTLSSSILITTIILFYTLWYRTKPSTPHYTTDPPRITIF